MSGRQDVLPGASGVLSDLFALHLTQKASFRLRRNSFVFPSAHAKEFATRPKKKPQLSLRAYCQSGRGRQDYFRAPPASSVIFKRGGHKQNRQSPSGSFLPLRYALSSELDALRRKCKSLRWCGGSAGFVWSGRQDSNLRPLAPHASALPGCATSRKSNEIYSV